MFYLKLNRNSEGYMAFAILIYLIGFIFSVFAFIYFNFRSNKNSGSRKSFWAMLLFGYTATYLISITWVYLAPYWYDNGVTEEIEFPYHFSWALLFSSFIQFFIIPLTIVLALKFNTRKLAKLANR